MIYIYIIMSFNVGVTIVLVQSMTITKKTFTIIARM